MKFSACNYNTTGSSVTDCISLGCRFVYLPLPLRCYDCLSMCLFNREICDVVHYHGGQVYLDGANMNAQVCRRMNLGILSAVVACHATFYSLKLLCN